VAGRSRTERSALSPAQARNLQAHRLRIAMTHRLRVTVWHRNGTEPTTGAVRALTNDYPTRLEASAGGSTLTVHFEDGSTVPLEQVNRIERAAV
jgi:hypothetical protein